MHVATTATHAPQISAPPASTALTQPSPIYTVALALIFVPSGHTKVQPISAHHAIPHVRLVVEEAHI